MDHATKRAATLAALASLLIATAAPAQALYIVTPLRLTPTPTEADVGDEVRFDVSPQNDSEAANWGGQTVIVWWAYDRNEKPADENATGDEPVSDEGRTRQVLRETLALDGKATATFTWTIPAEAKDHNVQFTLGPVGGGDPLAFADVRVGNAPPMMKLLAGSGPAEPAPVEDRVEDGPDAGEDGEATGGRATPAAGVALVAAAALVAAVALRRRR